MTQIARFITGFWNGFFHTLPRQTGLHAERKLRDDLSERQIDSMIDDSFPASDPPSSY